MSNKKNNGFTMIELIVVIAIIAVLTTVVAASLGSAKSEGTDAGKIRTVAEIRNALNVYFNDPTASGGNGNYPAGNGVAVLTSALVPKYIGSIDPNIKYQSTNVTNTATCSSGCQSYHLAIPLSKNDNIVLKNDRDANDTVINGAVDNCVSGAASVPDLCYDVTP